MRSPNRCPVRTAGTAVFTCLTVLLSQGDASSEPAGDHPVTAELIAETTSIRPGTPFWTALRLRMEDGWHVNWINPGDAGLPPSIRWKLPEGFEADEIQWPYPDRIKVGSLCLFGFGKEVLLLSRLTPPASLPAGSDVGIAATADWLACREGCIPGEAALALTLPVGLDEPRLDPRWIEAFAATRERLPITESKWTFRGKISERRIFVFAHPPAGSPSAPSGLFFFPFLRGLIENGEPQVLKSAHSEYRLEIERSPFRRLIPASIRGILVSAEGWDEEGSKKALLVDVPIE